MIVEVELDTELRIPKGSSAELVSELMGGVRMNILLANNPREKYAIGDTIRHIEQRNDGKRSETHAPN